MKAFLKKIIGGDSGYPNRMDKSLLNILTKDKPFRFERKFIVTDMPITRLEYVVKFHPALFTEIFAERRVNNVYFDTKGYHNYFDNVEGVPNRLKMRIRWYGDTFGEVVKPVLEMKIKNGLLGTKLSYKLKPFAIPNSENLPDFIQIFEQSDLPFTILEMAKEMEPTLINCYNRRYYMSDDKNFRITIDKKLKYYKIGLEMYKSSSKINEDFVLELKYEQEHDMAAESISTQFPFRLSKSSKYVSGFERLYL